MRYFLECAYNGAAYAGWQRQPGDRTVQQTLEEAFSLILREEIEITGCGRTDAGVHATQYFFHLDTEQKWDRHLMHRFNRYLPQDISLLRAYEAPPERSARFDALRRTYRYIIRFEKDALAPGLSVWIQKEGLDIPAMQEMALLLMHYREFKPFCKEGSDARHYACRLFDCMWHETDRGVMFEISANRFLRGMVRLIVGASLQLGRGKLLLDEVRHTMEAQTPIPRADSAPAQGLFLTHVEYPLGMLIPVSS